MRVKIDRTLCMGTGNCVDVAPEQFDQSESDGLVVLKRECVAVGYKNKVCDAVEFCPVKAITIIE